MAAVDWRHEPQVQAWQRRSVAALFGSQAVASIGSGAGVGMGSLIAYEVTRDEALAGLSRIVAAISVALLAVPLANLAASCGRRSALALGWGLAALGSVLLVLAGPTHSLLLLMAGMFGFGAGTAASLQSRFAATDMAAPERRASTLSLVLWGGTVGSVIGPNLAPPGEWIAARLGIPPICGTYVLAAIALALGATLVFVLLRPDPMQVAESHGEGVPSGKRGASWRAVAAIWREPYARLALVAIVLNQFVMTGVMTLTPVHMRHTGHTLAAVGITLSGHVFGMYGLSPVVGWLADRLGKLAMLWACVGLNAAALVCCALAGGNLAAVITGLFLLGVGWSCGMVAGSALLVDRVDPEHRANAQGASDTVMNIGAAIAAGAAGPILAIGGFAGLAGVFAIPVVIIAAALVGAAVSAR